MTLENLNIENGLFLTDKGRIHSYLPFYDDLFLPFKDKGINIFEVGFQYGGSCRLWERYFKYANIRAIDITMDRPHIESAKALGIATEIVCGTRVTKEIIDIKDLTPEYFDNFPVDIAIDDGSHTLEDQLFFVRLIYPLVREGGLIIIEDIQNIDNQFDEFKKLGHPCSKYDTRETSGVYDDVLIIYNK